MKLDDFTYKTYPELVKLIPRGFSVLVDGKENEIVRLDGMQKFDGSSILDDDSNIETHLIDYDAIGKWKDLEVSFQEKANGKMAIFKVFKYNNQIYVLGGSKNCHYLHIYDDVPTPKPDDLAGNILHLFKQSNLPLEEILGKTVIGEYVDGQHMVYTSTPYMQYFYPPSIASVVEILPKQNYTPTEDQYQYLRNLQDIEGVVIVYRNPHTREIYRQKHKTIWYIILRSMRECLKKCSKVDDPENIHNKLMQVIRKRSTDFLNISYNTLREWSNLSKQFIDFIIDSHYNFSDLSYTSTGMAIIWHQFISGTYIRPPPPSIQDQEYKINYSTELVEYGAKLIQNGIKVCFVLRGISGSGKSTLAKTLKKRFPEMEIFSTDSYFETPTGYVFDPKKLGEYHNSNFNRFSESKSDVLCVDNTNTTYLEYSRYTKDAKNRGYISIVLTLEIDCESALARSQHITKLSKLVQMKKKLKPVDVKPVYYGVFLKREDVPNAVQQTPLHVTCALKQKVDTFGETVNLKVIGLSLNKAGRCYVVEKIAQYQLGRIPHITLETFDGYKPVDVGLNIDMENIIPMEFTLKGIFGPIN